MNKNIKIVLSLVIAAALLGGGFYYFKNDEKVNNEPAPLSASVKGCYVAKLAKDVYTLVLEEQNGEAVTGKIAYNNYQKDSSSGSFEGTFSGDILTGNYSFDSEGSHSDRQLIFKKAGDSFVQGFGPVDVIDGKEVFVSNEITYDPKSTFVKSEDCANLFTDSNDTFSFLYNPYFFAYEGERFLTTEWRQNSTRKGLILGNVVVQKTFMPGTNFSDARLTVGRSTEPGAIRGCFTDKIDSESNTGATTISGYPFAKFGFTGAVAGNLYETTSYRGIVDGDCYAVEYTIHSTNIGNYSPDSGVKEFDKAKVQGELEKIIQSFKFLISSD